MNAVPHTKLPVRLPAKGRYDAFATRRRLPLVEVVELGIEALEQMPKRDLDALIERRPRRVKASA